MNARPETGRGDRTERAHSRLALALAATALIAAAVAMLRDGDGPAPAPGGASTPAPLPSLALLPQQLAALQQRVDQLEVGRSRIPVVDRSSIEAIVDELLAARGYAAGARPAADVPAVDVTTLATALGLAHELQQAGVGPRNAELWQQLRDLGAVDAAVAFFERVAAANPASPDAQTQLGAAYVEKLLQSTDELQRIELGKRIDAQYDRALELQPDHWEARFRKALGLSYGPALSGRRSEAIAQFERLVRQQAASPAQAGYAQTYLYLGRLLEQQGDRDRAIAIWQQGLARHPQDRELQQLARGP